MYADLPRYIENFMNSQNPKKITQLIEQVKQRYFDNKPFTEESIPSIIRLLSDIHFNIPTDDFVDKRRKRKQASTYFYKFSYVGNQMTQTRLMGNKLTTIGIHITQFIKFS